MSRASTRILPMQTAGTHHFIERTYREGSQYQWVRESLVNALEAGATRIEFGVEWQAVENRGVYRRMIADNGCGMTGEQLVEFFNTFGGSGKPIGGAHENFGVGSKTSLLPWNHYGMVVISWVNGDASMIWVTRDPETSEYGLKLEQCYGPTGELIKETVYDPYDDPDHGCDWATIKPDWIGDHGTVVVLLGNSPAADTVEGDPGRSEAEVKGISSFLNRRLWEFSDGVEVYVDEFRTSSRELWPTSQAIAHGPAPKVGKDRRTNTRKIEGARYFIEFSSARTGQGKLGAQGTLPLRDGSAVDWYLWEGERPQVHSHAAEGGYIAALYNNELYDVSAHHSTYRSFGVSESSVRSRLWLIIRPIVDPEGKRGVYPKTDRNSLLIRGGKAAGGPLPYNDWAAEFADNMPGELLQALKAVRLGSTGSLTDEEWRDKLADRFGSRWRIARLRARRNGSASLDPTITGQPIRQRKQRSGGGSDSSGGSRQSGVRPDGRFGKSGSATPGELAQTSGGLPRYRPVAAAELGEGILAAWQPKDPMCPEGVVLLNIEHPVLRSVIEHWQSQYADHHAEMIEKDVIAVYGQVAVSKIAHSEFLKSVLPAQVVEKDLRSDLSLTMSLLGLMAEDHLISTRIGGKYSKKRLTVVERRGARQSPEPSPDS